MERSAPPRIGTSPRSSAADHRAWNLLLVALLAWQSWMALTLFGRDRPWNNLLDDQPILSGRHPLHLYHGYLGAQSLLKHGSLSCYDPSFHAGYPKTPLFDSGSRPAELMLALTGGRYCPAAYKIGVFLLAASVPLLLFVAARGIGLKRLSACLACVLGLLVWWGQPCREALEGGDIDQLWAMLLLLVQAGLLIRYHSDPGPFSWLGVVCSALIGWFAQPMLLALFVPLFLIYYLSVGARHQLTWHLALLGGLLVSIAVNGFWLIDWIGYWWIRVPPHGETPLLTEPTLRSIWEAPLWGGMFDKAMSCVLLLASLVGVVMYNQRGQRATARLLGISEAAFLALSVAGLLYEPLGRFGAPRLLLPSLLFAALPTAHALTVTLAASWRRPVGHWLSLAAAVALVVLIWHAPAAALESWSSRLWAATPLQLGLDADQQAILEAVQQHTTAEARILWEDQAVSPLASHWTPLLSLLTQRAYIGGLDSEVRIEYTTNGLVDAVLMGRPIREWSNAALEEYCKRYNVGWVVCWSPAACQRLHDWPHAIRTATLPPPAAGAPPGCLFTVRREKPSFALIGSARWLHADTGRIVLGEVIPQRSGPDNHGKKPILLSLHYHAGMRVAPSRVVLDSYSIEPVNSVPGDARPFVRLWVEEPVTRVTIIWDKR